jgi:ABC-type glycerol-3-phosphate transport system substrate-binding protein
VEKTLTRRDFLKVGGGALAGAYVLTLTGCGGGEGEGRTSSSVTLFHDKPTWPFEKMGKRSSKAIGIGIEASEYADTTSYQQAIKSSLRAGESPGLFTWWSGYNLISLAREGGLQDVSSTWASQVEKGNLAEDLRKPFAFEGKQYAVPTHVSYWPVYYNKRVFEKQGLAPPETWDELMSIAGTLKKADVTPFYATVDGRWPAFIWFEELMIRTDPDFYSRLMEGEESYTDPVVVDVMKEWKSMIEAGYFTQLDMPMDATAVGEFKQGNFLFHDAFGNVGEMKYDVTPKSLITRLGSRPKDKEDGAPVAPANPAAAVPPREALREPSVAR